jgi:hypothetical protein
VGAGLSLPRSARRARTWNASPFSALRACAPLQALINAVCRRTHSFDPVGNSIEHACSRSPMASGARRARCSSVLSRP